MIVKLVELLDHIEMRKTDCFERQDLSCTYLAHHELESVKIIIIIIIIMMDSSLLPVVWRCKDQGISIDRYGHFCSCLVHCCKACICSRILSLHLSLIRLP